MTDQPPEVLYLDTLYEDFAVCRWDKQRAASYLRADTAIPRAEADAMVAAAVASCAEVLEECGIDGSAFAQTFEEYRRGRAAFEQAVREAVEAERERIVKIVAGYVGCDNIVDAIRAPQETSE